MVESIWGDNGKVRPTVRAANYPYFTYTHLHTCYHLLHLHARSALDNILFTLDKTEPTETSVLPKYFFLTPWVLRFLDLDVIPRVMVTMVGLLR